MCLLLTGTYSLDDMSDDEDYMPRGSGGASGSSAITSSQLAQALASTSTSSTPQSAQVGGDIVRNISSGNKHQYGLMKFRVELHFVCFNLLSCNWLMCSYVSYRVLLQAVRVALLPTSFNRRLMLLWGDLQLPVSALQVMGLLLLHHKISRYETQHTPSV